MAQPNPASTAAPLYLTGNKAGLQQFLNNYDVCTLPDPCTQVTRLLIRLPHRSSCLTATVRSLRSFDFGILSVSALPRDSTSKITETQVAIQVSCGRETTASPEQSRLWNCYGEMVRSNRPQ